MLSFFGLNDKPKNMRKNSRNSKNSINTNNKKKNNISQQQSNQQINQKTKNTTFPSNQYQKVTIVKDPSTLRNSKNFFPTFEYEGGDGFKSVKITLNPNQEINADAGAMNYMTNNMKIETQMGSPLRLFSSTSFFYNTFYNDGNQKAQVNLSSLHPGDVTCFYIPNGHSFNFVSDTYICSTTNLNIDTDFRLGGFILGYGIAFVSVTATNGPGLVWCGSYGNTINYTLKQNEKIKIDNGVLLGFEDNAKLETTSVGGFMSTIFSGEGLVTEIKNDNTEPVTIYLQSRSKIDYNNYIKKIAGHKYG